MKYAGTRRLGAIQIAITLIALLAVTLPLTACSPACGPTENEIAQIKPMVSSITIGYENGSTVELTSQSANLNNICDEVLRIALSIDKQCRHVVELQTIEQLSETHQKFVHVSFAQPTEITTCIFVDEEDRYYITTNEKGFRTLTLTELVIWPQGTLPEIWTCIEAMCSVWGSGRSMGKLEALIDDLGQLD